MSGSTSPYCYTCELCGEDGFNNTTMRVHTMTRHVKGVELCPFCHLAGQTYEGLLEHVNQAHLDYLTPDSDLLDYIDDGHPVLEEDTKQLMDTFSYHTPNSMPTGWMTPESESRASNEMNTSKMSLTEDFVCNNDNAKRSTNVHYTDAGCLNGVIILSDSESPSPKKLGSAGHGSPLRSQLNLTLAKPNKPKVPSPSPMKQCLMCEFTSNCPKQLEEHMNRAHFDLTSPTFVDNANVPDTNGYENPTFNLTNPSFDCPICEKCFPNASLVETHINNHHSDVLSPIKVDTTNASTSTNCTSKSREDEVVASCPVCNQRMPNSTQEQMLMHIDEHFDSNVDDHFLSFEEVEARRLKEERDFQMLRAQYGMEEDDLSYSTQAAAGMKKAVYNGSLSVSAYYQKSIDMKKANATGIDDSASSTKDVVDRIAVMNETDSNIVQYFLCSAVDHYASAYGDRGWGCGYRNMQMVISSMLHHSEYANALRAGMSKVGVPSIPTLQKMVEKAWAKGFDVQGAEQLGSKLYNTRKWIGACEVVALFSSLRIRCELVDFHKPTGNSGTHPALFDWVLKYFYYNPDDFKPPLYLQHQGHSRTIIGYERHRDGKITLLILDPSHAPAQVNEALLTPSGLRLFRRDFDALRAKQYQLVAIKGIMESQHEFSSSKILQSMRIPQDR